MDKRSGVSLAAGIPIQFTNHTSQKFSWALYIHGANMINWRSDPDWSSGIWKDDAKKDNLWLKSTETNQLQTQTHKMPNYGSSLVQPYGRVSRTGRGHRCGSGPDWALCQSSVAVSAGSFLVTDLRWSLGCIGVFPLAPPLSKAFWGNVIPHLPVVADLVGFGHVLETLLITGRQSLKPQHTLMLHLMWNMPPGKQRSASVSAGIQSGGCVSNFNHILALELQRPLLSRLPLPWSHAKPADLCAVPRTLCSKQIWLDAIAMARSLAVDFPSSYQPGFVV